MIVDVTKAIAEAKRYIDNINTKVGDEVVKIIRNGNNAVELLVGGVPTYYDNFKELISALELLDLLARVTKAHKWIEQEHPDITLD